MEALRNELQDTRNAFVARDEKPVTKGYFNINLANSKCVLKLKGKLTSSNITWITKSLIRRKIFDKKFIELDMSGVDTIDMRAMALLIITISALPVFT